VLKGQEPVLHGISKKINQRTSMRTLRPIYHSNFYIISTDSWNSRHDFGIILKRLRRANLVPPKDCWIIDCRSLERLGQIIVVNLNDNKAFKKYFTPLEEASVDTTVLPCDRANVIDLPIHLARFLLTLLWNHATDPILPTKMDGSYQEYYINAYAYKMVRIT